MDISNSKKFFQRVSKDILNYVVLPSMYIWDVNDLLEQYTIKALMTAIAVYKPASGYTYNRCSNVCKN